MDKCRQLLPWHIFLDNHNLKTLSVGFSPGIPIAIHCSCSAGKRLVGVTAALNWCGGVCNGECWVCDGRCWDVVVDAGDGECCLSDQGLTGSSRKHHHSVTVSFSVPDHLKFSLSPWECGWSLSSGGQLASALQLGDGTVYLHPLPKGFLSHLPEVLLPNRRDLHPVKRQ